MMKNFRTVLSAAVLSSTMFLGVASAQDAQVCQPGLGAAFAAHQPSYSALIGAMFVGMPTAVTLTTDLAAVTSEPTYATLLADSQAMAAKIPTGRVVITVPDGTVMVDTSKNNNTLANFQAKLINENHNSRVAILAAQQYPCGLGLERKLSTTDGTVETYLAFRAGTHLDSLGTLRVSTKQ